VGRLILVDEPAGTAGVCGRTAVYAWVSSADPKADLDWQVARATTQQTPVDLVVTDVGSALNGHRRRFLALLGDRSVDLIVVASGPVVPVRIGVRLRGAGRAVDAAAGADGKAA
jgi:predicted site-specific integrase-resolvase